MVKVSLVDKLLLKISSDNLDYYRSLKEFFTVPIPNYWFVSRFRYKSWTGTGICFYNAKTKTIPCGLIADFLKFHYENFPKEELRIDDDVKNSFRETNIKIKYELKYKPYYYQKDCIEKLLRYKKGIVRVATGGGKSLIIAYLISNLRDNNLSKKSLIIVPRISLIKQFKNDLIDYGIDEDFIGMIGDSHKEYEKEIIISTWQSLNFIPKFTDLEKNKKRKKFLKDHFLKTFDTVVVDETHLVQSKVLRTIVSEVSEAEFRFGLTGTLHDDRLELLNTKSFIGPILTEYSSSSLAETGYVSRCNVLTITIDYDRSFGETYDEVKHNIFLDEARLNVISEIVGSVREPVLCLVGFIEREGEILKRYLSSKFPNKKIIFLYGLIDSDEREFWRKKANEEKDIVIIATYGIFQLGINIPALKYLLLVSPFKAKIRVLQSIGRVLRRFSSKEKSGAFVIDFWDKVKFLDKHAQIRNRYYNQEKFSVEYFGLDELDSLKKRLRRFE